MLIIRGFVTAWIVKGDNLLSVDRQPGKGEESVSYKRQKLPRVLFLSSNDITKLNII